jgi:hypothetical protein
VIKILNTARLSFFVDNSDTHGLKSGRQVAVRRRNASRRSSSSVKMAAPLATYTKEEQRSVIRFLVVKGWNPLKFIDEWKFSMVIHVCHYSKCTSGLGSSWSLSGPTKRCSRRCKSGCGPAKIIFFFRGIHALPKRWNTCMERNGDYMEKWSHCVHFVFNKLRGKKY